VKSELKIQTYGGFVIKEFFQVLEKIKNNKFSRYNKYIFETNVGIYLMITPLLITKIIYVVNRHIK